MSASAVAAAQASPLGQLEAEERATVIGVLNARLAPREAVQVLTALSGSREEVFGLPWDVQVRAQALLLAAFPKGINAVVVSVLGIALVSADTWLPQIRAKINAMTLDAAAEAIDSGRLLPPPQER